MFHELWNFYQFWSLRKNRVELVIFIVLEQYETGLKQCYFWLLFGCLVTLRYGFLKLRNFLSLYGCISVSQQNFIVFVLEVVMVDRYVLECSQVWYVKESGCRGRVETLVWYSRSIIFQLLERYILDFLQYCISFLKVLFQKCEQQFKLFITYCKDNIRIVFLFVGCIICLLYFFISQNLEVQYLVLGVLCSRFMILYIQFLELCMLCISG